MDSTEDHDFPPVPLEHPGDWALMAKLFSLDLTGSMRGYLGLEVSDYDALVGVIREAMEAQPPPDPAGPPSDLGEDVLARVDAQLGRDQAQVLYDYGNTTFRYAFRDKRRYDFWSIFLGQCRWEDPLWEALELPPKHDLVFKNRFLNSQENSRYLADLHRASEAEMTPWDLKMHLDDVFGDEGRDPSTPEIVLGSLSAVQRNGQFWRWVVSTFTSGECRDLHRNAQLVVKARPQFSFIDALVEPHALAGAEDIARPDEDADEDDA